MRPLARMSFLTFIVAILPFLMVAAAPPECSGPAAPPHAMSDTFKCCKACVCNTQTAAPAPVLQPAVAPQWYQVTNFPGWEAFGVLNANGWLENPTQWRPTAQVTFVPAAQPVAPPQPPPMLRHGWFSGLMAPRCSGPSCSAR